MLIQYPHNLDRLLISVDIEGTPGVELSIYWNFYKATVISINLQYYIPSSNLFLCGNYGVI